MQYFLILTIFLLVAAFQQIRRPKHIALDWKEYQGAIKVIYNDVKSYAVRDRFKNLHCDSFMKVNTEGRNWYFVNY